MSRTLLYMTLGRNSHLAPSGYFAAACATLRDKVYFEQFIDVRTMEEYPQLLTDSGKALLIRAKADPLTIPLIQPDAELDQLLINAVGAPSRDAISSFR
jgi:hypothetical protein